MCQRDARGQQRRMAERQNQWGIIRPVLEGNVGDRGAQRERVRGGIEGATALVWDTRPGGKQRARQNGMESKRTALKSAVSIVRGAGEGGGEDLDNGSGFGSARVMHRGASRGLMEAAEGREGESAGNGCTVDKSLMKREERRRRKVRLAKLKKGGGAPEGWQWPKPMDGPEE